ncbi:hypothetical protein FGO68_gene2771 [Halteria grandinella]|uniref:EF-hand domain-containing protein n=1 Tax=Halteria grandinella TaxID=5974 RepID=A0A8J8NX70_HALGN|nr:hypothetical protein FGO68_gene2771 [Halteria grandinella]
MVTGQGGKEARAFTRFDHKVTADGKISFPEFQQMIRQWNIAYNQHSIQIPTIWHTQYINYNEYYDEAAIDRDFLAHLFKAADISPEDQYLSSAEFTTYFDIIQQFDPTVFVTLYIIPKSMTKERFGMVIEEIYQSTVLNRTT